MRLAGISILVVDDEPELRELFVEELKDRGAEVTCVDDGQQAWAALGAGKFDVVLSDARMPAGNGLELIKRISEELPTKPLVFLCTGYADLDAEEAKSYGVVEIFDKPFEISHIARVIAQHMAPRANAS